MIRYSPEALTIGLMDPSVEAERIKREPRALNSGKVFPGDVFNEQFDEGTVLEWLDFTPSHSDFQGQHYTRPGKSSRDGTSATVYNQGDDSHVTIWSDTVRGKYPNLELRRPYDAFGLYVATYFDGDFSKASTALIAEDYGNQRPVDPSVSFLEELEADIELEALGRPPELPESTWVPINIRLAMNGPTEPGPDLFEREDGQCLLYRGRIHSFQGEPESGKSWGAQAALYECINAGGRVMMIDFENSFSSVRDRLLDMGMSRDILIDRFKYVRPDDPLGDLDRERLLLAAAAQDLIILDGVTDGMGIMGLDPISLTDSAAFNNQLLRPLADTGAAVVIIDHVAKNSDSRGRWAIGSGHKRAAITGASYIFEKVDQFGRGMVGCSRLIIGKDKPGYIRQVALNEVAADFHLDGCTTGKVTFRLAEPSDISAQNVMASARIMEQISNYVSVNPGEKRRTILTLCGSMAADEYLEAAFDKLFSQNYIANDMGDRNRYRLVRPFYEVDSMQHSDLVSKRFESHRENSRHLYRNIEQMNDEPGPFDDEPDRSGDRAEPPASPSHSVLSQTTRFSSDEDWVQL